jgi:hypothetical protein
MEKACHSAGAARSTDSRAASAESMVLELLARYGCSAILYVAAIFKAHQLLTDPALGVIYGSRWVDAALVEYELFLGAWLLTGVAARRGRQVALVTFIGFACYSFYLGISGAASCGCFGTVRVSPWWSFTLDMWLVLLLASSTSAATHTLFGSPHRFIRWSRLRMASAIAVLVIVTAIPLLSIAAWHPVVPSASGVSLGHGNLVILEPEKWIGNLFPLDQSIEMADPGRLRGGSWVLVFYHRDCPKCRLALASYERLAQHYKDVGTGVDIALIEVPSFARGEHIASRLCQIGRLSASKEWIIKTPAEVRVTDGEVTGATSDEDTFLYNTILRID